MTRRAGMSLVELIVALTVLSAGVLGLAGAAAVAHRAFTDADAIERAARAAAFVIDSLMLEPQPIVGGLTLHRSNAAWTVDPLAPGLSRITVEVAVGAARGMTLTYHAVHSARLLR